MILYTFIYDNFITLCHLPLQIRSLNSLFLAGFDAFLPLSSVQEPYSEALSTPMNDPAAVLGIAQCGENIEK